MFNRFDAFLLQLIAIQTIYLSMHSCLNITQMSVQSVAIAPEEVVLTCAKQDDNGNDTFEYLRWYKQIDNNWELIKVSLPPTDAKDAEATNSTSNTPKADKIVLYKLEGLVETDDTNIKLSQTSLSSAGRYKCILKSKLEMTELVKEMRVVYTPPKELKPEISLVKQQDDHIIIKCIAPASYPITAINFFVNYQLAAHEDIHRLSSIKTKNASHGVGVDLIQAVEELKIKATENNVINSNISVICSTTFADLYSNSALLVVPYSGTVSANKCMSLPIIVLIIIIVLLLIVAIVAVFWVVMRKKRLNALNKVAELFNKPKTITVLVENTTNTKVE